MWIENQKNHIDSGQSDQKKKKWMEKLCNVCLARSQQITVTTNTNINRHPLTMTEWIIERRQPWRPKNIPMRTINYIKSVWQLRKEIGNVGQSFSTVSRIIVCCGLLAGHLAIACHTDQAMVVNSIGWHMNDDNFFEKYCYRRSVWVASFAVRVNKIPLNLIDESESSPKRQHHNDYKDRRRRLRWVFPFLAFIFAIVFKVYNLPTNAAIGSFESWKMGRKQYPFSWNIDSNRQFCHVEKFSRIGDQNNRWRPSAKLFFFSCAHLRLGWKKQIKSWPNRLEYFCSIVWLCEKIEMSLSSRSRLNSKEISPISANN